VGSHVAGQLIRCGTSPGANYNEAVSAESRNDFVHKLSVVLKELRETAFWLEVTRRRKLVDPPSRLAPLTKECGELIAIIAASIRTAESNRGH